MYYEQAQVAADWWIEQMKKRCNQATPSKVIVDGSNFVVIDYSLAQELHRFHSILTKEIQHYLETNNYISYTCYMIPNSALSNIAKKAKISTSYFPYRAEMTIFDRKVHVSLSGEHLRELS